MHVYVYVHGQVYAHVHVHGHVQVYVYVALVCMMHRATLWIALRHLTLHKPEQWVYKHIQVWQKLFILI